MISVSGAKISTRSSFGADHSKFYRMTAIYTLSFLVKPLIFKLKSSLALPGSIFNKNQKLDVEYDRLDFMEYWMNWGK